LYWVGLGWVSQLMGWVGLGQTKWTHEQLCGIYWHNGLGVELAIEEVTGSTLGKLFTPVLDLSGVGGLTP